ncbi:MAG: GNAT family N-acetyltransferase [Armatimonadota bacterium]
MGTSVECITRQGTADDAEEILSVEMQAFRREWDTAEWAQQLAGKRGTAQQYRVLEVDGRIVSQAQVAPHRLRLGRAAEVLKGDVGGVATLPECQGLGYGHALMRDVVAWMREAGYHLSRLGGYAKFYGRFGYVPMPRRHVLFPVGPVKAGASTIPAEEIFRQPADLPGTVRPYDVGRDIIQRGDLFERFNAGRSGAFLRDRAFEELVVAHHPAFPTDPLQIVYEVDGLARGYALGHATEPNSHVSQPAISVGDLAIDPAHPEALIALIKHMLGEAHRRGLPLVMVRMPFDESLFAILRAEQLECRLVEQHEGLASNMMQIIHLEALLRAAAPELAANLADAGLADLLPPLVLEFTANDQRATLAIRHGTAELTDGTPDIRLALDQGTLMKLLFGLTTFAEADFADKAALPPAARAALTGLFPRQACSGGYALG